MSGELVENLLIVAAVAVIIYILWRNNTGAHRTRSRGGDGGGGD